MNTDSTDINPGLDNTPDTDQDVEKQADAMKDQLRKDVASWSSARSENAGITRPEYQAATAKPASKPPAARAKRAAAPPAEAPTDVPAKKKPFGMSYDGVSQADYITYIISRGAR